MAGPLSEIAFWILVVTIAVAHAFILRSTIRGMHAADPRARGVWEWVWALLPAAGLVVLFVWTWHVMHPDTISVTLPEHRLPPGGISTS